MLNYGIIKSLTNSLKIIPMKSDAFENKKSAIIGN